MSLIETAKKMTDKELKEQLSKPRRAYDIDVAAANEAILRLDARLEKLEAKKGKKDAE